MLRFSSVDGVEHQGAGGQSQPDRGRVGSANGPVRPVGGDVRGQALCEGPGQRLHHSDDQAAQADRAQAAAADRVRVPGPGQDEPRLGGVQSADLQEHRPDSR